MQRRIWKRRRRRIAIGRQEWKEREGRAGRGGGAGADDGGGSDAGELDDGGGDDAGPSGCTVADFDAWTSAVSLPANRESVGAMVIDEQLHVFGGWAGAAASEPTAPLTSAPRATSSRTTSRMP